LRPREKNSSGRANFCERVKGRSISQCVVYTCTRSQDGQDGSPQPVLGFGKQHAIRKHRCQHWGRRWVLVVLVSVVWQADAAVQRQPGSRAWGELAVQRGMVSGAGQRAGYRD
jgi:hypothetical protein